MSIQTELTQEIVDLETALERERKHKDHYQLLSLVYYQEIRNAHKGIRRLKNGNANLRKQLALQEPLAPVEVGDGHGTEEDPWGDDQKTYNKYFNNSFSDFASG